MVCREWLREGRFFIQLSSGEENPLRLQDRLSPYGSYLRWDTITLPWIESIYLMLHKPPGYECSHRPTHYSSVFELLPQPWVQRGIEAAGRLDADTTGLLLFSTDGKWLHQFTSPRKHIEKAYRVTHTHALLPSDFQRLQSGIHLRGETEPTLPAKAEKLNETVTRLWIHEGRYHQVKRMFAAIGQEVLALHREAVGPYPLPDDLLPGQWRLIPPSVESQPSSIIDVTKQQG